MALNERLGDKLQWFRNVHSVPTVHSTSAMKAQKFVFRGHRNGFLGKEMCISFLVCSAVMLWVDFLELAMKMMMMIIMGHGSQAIRRTCTEAYAARRQAPGEHTCAPCFEGRKSKWAGQTKLTLSSCQVRFL